MRQLRRLFRLKLPRRRLLGPVVTFGLMWRWADNDNKPRRRAF